MAKTTKILAASATGLALLLAAPTPGAHAADGERLFNKYCSVCHSLESGRNKFGPSLSGVVGRMAGSIENYSYSESMRAIGKAWTPEQLDLYLSAPSKIAPGTKMTFPGLPNGDDRKGLIDFLTTIHD